MEIPILTEEEIQELQVDAALRKLGQYTVILTKLNTKINYAMITANKARNSVDCLKNDKMTIIENMRALKAIAARP